jgi:hypothetical protein
MVKSDSLSLLPDKFRDSKDLLIILNQNQID